MEARVWILERYGRCVFVCGCGAVHLQGQAGVIGRGRSGFDKINCEGQVIRGDLGIVAPHHPLAQLDRQGLEVRAIGRRFSSQSIDFLAGFEVIHPQWLVHHLLHAAILLPPASPIVKVRGGGIRSGQLLGKHRFIASEAHDFDDLCGYRGSRRSCDDLNLRSSRDFNNTRDFHILCDDLGGGSRRCCTSCQRSCSSQPNQTDKITPSHNLLIYFHFLPLLFGMVLIIFYYCIE